MMCIVVDGVADVLSIDVDNIKPTPDVASVLSGRYLLGLVESAAES